MDRPGANALIKPLGINSRAKHFETGLRRVKMLGFSDWGLPIARRQWSLVCTQGRDKPCALVFYGS